MRHVYEVRPCKDRRGFDLISDALPFGRLWYTKPGDAIRYAKFRSRSHDAVIRVFDDAGNVPPEHVQRRPNVGKGLLLSWGLEAHNRALSRRS